MSHNIFHKNVLYPRTFLSFTQDALRNSLKNLTVESVISCKRITCRTPGNRTTVCTPAAGRVLDRMDVTVPSGSKSVCDTGTHEKFSSKLGNLAVFNVCHHFQKSLKVVCRDFPGTFTICVRATCEFCRAGWCKSQWIVFFKFAIGRR